MRLRLRLLLSLLSLLLLLLPFSFGPFQLQLLSTDLKVHHSQQLEMMGQFHASKFHKRQTIFRCTKQSRNHRAALARFWSRWWFRMQFYFHPKFPWGNDPICLTIAYCSTASGFNHHQAAVDCWGLCRRSFHSFSWSCYRSCTGEMGWSGVECTVDQGKPCGYCDFWCSSPRWAHSPAGAKLPQIFWDETQQKWGFWTSLDNSCEVSYECKKQPHHLGFILGCNQHWIYIGYIGSGTKHVSINPSWRRSPRRPAKCIGTVIDFINQWKLCHLLWWMTWVPRCWRRMLVP